MWYKIDWLYIKPCCSVAKRLLLAICSTNVFRTSLSIHLPCIEVKLIGIYLPGLFLSSFLEIAETLVHFHASGSLHSCCFLTSSNEFSGIIYSLFRERQNIFLTIFSTKFVVKCATKILKIG